MAETTNVALEITSYGPTDIDRRSFDSFSLDGMNDDQRVATLNIVRGTLVDLIESLEAWVPDSFIADTNTRLDLVISFDLVEVDHEVLRRHVQAERRLKDVASDLLALRSEFDD